MQKLSLSAIIFLFYLPHLAHAAATGQEETLKPIVVTATRMETPEQEVTTSITVITAQEIQQQQAKTVLEVLGNVPGLDVVQSGSRGATTSVFIRGAESDQVLVLIDGVEVNSVAAGGFDFAHLTTENVERIEVLRGAGGTLYGSQAVGGVIQIFTKSGSGSPELTASVEGGNGSTHRQVMTFGGKARRLGYFLSASRLETEGFEPFNDDYQNLAASGRLDLDVLDNAELRGLFQFRKTDRGLFNSNNFLSDAGDPNSRFNTTDYLFKFDWDQNPLPDLDYRISFSQFKQHDKASDDPEPGSFDARERSRFRPRIMTAELQSSYSWQDWSRTTFGVEYKRRQASTSSSSNFVDLGGINRAIRNMGYYLQNQIELLDSRLILLPGLRVDDHQNFGLEWSPSISAAYLIQGTGTKLKGGYAEGFRAPTLNELFFPPGFGCAAFGNPDLGPEKSWEISAGADQSLFMDRLQVGATYFHREVRDLVGTGPTPDPADPAFCVRAENRGQARFDGVELTAGIKPLSTLSVGASYTYLDWDTEDGRLPRRPRHRGSINADYTYERYHINVDADFVGRRDDLDAATGGDISQSGYVKLDIAGSYRLPGTFLMMKRVTLFAKIENLLDQDYEPADGFKAPPLNFLIGIRSTLGGEE